MGFDGEEFISKQNDVHLGTNAQVHEHQMHTCEQMKKEQSETTIDKVHTSTNFTHEQN